MTRLEGTRYMDALVWRPMSSAWPALYLLLGCGSAGCHNPVGLSLDRLDPDAPYFGWLSKIDEGEVEGGELVRRDQSVPVLSLPDETLFVFPVRAEDIVALGLEVENLPERQSITEAVACEPSITPSQFFRVDGDELVPDAEARVSVSGAGLRTCSGAVPDLRMHGFSGRSCIPRVTEVASCEHEIEFDPGCSLPPELWHWRLHSLAEGRACVAPLPLGACVPSPGTGRILAETVCPNARAVLSRPAGELGVKVASVPGNPLPRYADGAVEPGTNGELFLRVGLVPDLVRVADGSIVVGSTSRVSNAVLWERDAVTSLHRFDADTLELIASSPPIPFLLLGLLTDGTSSDTVLAAVTSTQPDTLRLVRYGLDGRERASTVLSVFEQDATIGNGARYVDAFWAPELDALVTLVAYQVRVAPDVYQYWVEVSLLDPETLALRARFDTTTHDQEVYANDALYAPTGGRPQLLLANDETDGIIRLEFDSAGPLKRVAGFKISEGGAATLQHSLAHVGPDGATRYFYSISSAQRSWRSVVETSFEMQFSTEGVPTLLASLGPELLLAPTLDPVTGDLELLLVEPTRLDVFRSTSSILPQVGPAGRAVSDGAGTVWMTLPWTGQIARIARQ